MTVSDTDDEVRVQITTAGQITIPKRFRGDEDAYHLEIKDDNGQRQFVLTPLVFKRASEI
jgi:bifunctional DNA-binding transcriptional regulator/antitoxin component of YhaV-PrlF toxin-antitoxin module